MYFAAPDEAIWIGVLRLGLHIPGARSRKERRRVVSSLRDHLQARHNLSVAEVGHLESRDRAVLAAVMVSNDAVRIRSQLDKLVHSIEARMGEVLVSRTVEVFPAGKEPFSANQTDWL